MSRQQQRRHSRPWQLPRQVDAEGGAALHSSCVWTCGGWSLLQLVMEDGVQDGGSGSRSHALHPWIHGGHKTFSTPLLV